MICRDGEIWPRSAFPLNSTEIFHFIVLVHLDFSFAALISRRESCWWTQWCMWYRPNTELNAEWKWVRNCTNLCAMHKRVSWPSVEAESKRPSCEWNTKRLLWTELYAGLWSDKWAAGQLVVSCPWTDYTMRAVLYWVSSGWSFRPNIASVSFTLETVGTCHQHLVKCFHPHRFYKV